MPRSFQMHETPFDPCTQVSGCGILCRQPTTPSEVGSQSSVKIFPTLLIFVIDLYRQAAVGAYDFFIHQRGLFAIRLRGLIQRSPRHRRRCHSWFFPAKDSIIMASVSSYYHTFNHKPTTLIDADGAGYIGFVSSPMSVLSCTVSARTPSCRGFFFQRQYQVRFAIGIRFC